MPDRTPRVVGGNGGSQGPRAVPIRRSPDLSEGAITRTPRDEDSDATLLARAAQEDQAAWRALYGRYRWFVWSVVRGFYQLDPATAEDVAMAVWGKLVVHIDSIQRPERLAGWLHRTAYNEAIGTLRRHRRQIPTDFEDDVEDVLSPGPEERAVDDETSRGLVTAFSRLGDECREMLWLMFSERELSYEGIAEILGRPEGAHGPPRRRCLDTLRALLDEALTDDTPR